jgi:CheY-like chemotaxis protein
VRPVRADAARLQQVLWNLLNNAMKFTPSGGRVTVELRPADGHVQMVVSDTGAGIDAAFLPHVFERFRQADASTTRQHGGLGLGLSIVKSLVELHGGSIVAASAGIGRGATFTVSLPACHRAVSGHDGDDASHTPGVRQQLEGSRILVVDDDRDARELIDVVLRGAGARVIGAESAEEALRQLAAARGGFDLILSDLGMPTVNGFELLRRVRSLPPAEGGVIPAVAVSAYARAEDCAAALAAGFQLHVSKPYEPDELIAACATAISQSAELPASRPPTA